MSPCNGLLLLSSATTAQAGRRQAEGGRRRVASSDTVPSAALRESCSSGTRKPLTMRRPLHGNGGAIAQHTRKDDQSRLQGKERLQTSSTSLLRVSPQVSRNVLKRIRLNSSKGKLLQCHHCQSMLEGSSWNDGLRTMFFADGTHAKIMYSRFMHAPLMTYI